MTNPYHNPVCKIIEMQTKQSFLAGAASNGTFGISSWKYVDDEDEEEGYDF